jgi:hypothetical protein
MSISFHIFRKSESENHYGGIDRLAPQWRHTHPADDEYNRSCDAVAEAIDGFVELSEAVRLGKFFVEIGTPIDFVGIEHEVATMANSWLVRGYDVTYFSYHSFLLGGLQFNYPQKGQAPEEILLLLIEDVFRDRLNEYLLFGVHSDAQRFASAVRALDRLKPGMFESSGGFVPSIHVIYDLNDLLRGSS